jgi:hypothetical protein
MLRHNKTDLNGQGSAEVIHRWIHVKERGGVSIAPREKMAGELQAQTEDWQTTDNPNADIEALRAAYQMVLASDAMANLKASSIRQRDPQPSRFLQTLRQLPQEKIKTPRVQEPRQTEPASSLWEWDALEETEKADSWRKRLLKQPTWFVSLSIGLCIAVSAAYAGLGYWLLMSGTPSQAAETSIFLNRQEKDLKDSTTSGLENLQKLQEQSRGGIVVPKENSSETEALNLLAMAKSPLENLTSSLPGLKKESVGRPDPFAPLLQEGVDNIPLMLQPKDILDDVMFTGFVDDVNAKDKVAIIQVSSGGLPQTLVKKIGESIVIDGEKLILKNITKDAVTLSVKGKSRRLALTPYVDTAPTAGGAIGNASMPGASSPGGNASSASSADAPTSSERSGANPKLMEPGG